MRKVPGSAVLCLLL